MENSIHKIGLAEWGVKQRTKVKNSCSVSVAAAAAAGLISVTLWSSGCRKQDHIISGEGDFNEPLSCHP